MVPSLETLLSDGNSSGVEKAALAIRQGKIVAFPTETVYGLGADARSSTAVSRLYEVKGRPRFNPLIVHVPDLDSAKQIAHFNEHAESLAKAFWPGPLTLVLRVRPDSGISSLVMAGLDTVAIRIPAHPVALSLLHAACLPIAAPSANLSGRMSPTCARHVRDSLSGRVDMILDGGAALIGVESTIVGLYGDKAVLLRPGGVPRETVESHLNMSLGQPEVNESCRSPGQLQSHYAPNSRMRLNVTRAAAGEALLNFGQYLVEDPEQAICMLDLSPSGNLAEAAANLFDFMHQLDALGARAIGVVPIPSTGLGETINDRLLRSAAPRRDLPLCAGQERELFGFTNEPS